MMSTAHEEDGNWVLRLDLRMLPKCPGQRVGWRFAANCLGGLAGGSLGLSW